jgi:cell wall-associated NlpC family hydrolase
MQSYLIRRGDTLWALAQRYGTTVNALMQANPQVKNRNLIYTGHHLNIPGSRDEFVPAKPSKSPAPSKNVAPSPKGAAGSQHAFDIAKKYLGWNARDLKVSKNAVGLAMHDWVGNTVNCANFVSGVLQAAGQIPGREHNDSVVGLMHNLDRDPNFKRVSLKDARPGDVVSMKTPGGHHVVMFAGWKNGRPMFIGSNNANADGTQRVTMGYMNYPIMAVHQYRG